MSSNATRPPGVPQVPCPHCPDKPNAHHVRFFNEANLQAHMLAIHGIKSQCICKIPTLESAWAQRNQTVLLDRTCPEHGRGIRPELWAGHGPNTKYHMVTALVWYGYERLTNPNKE